MPIPSTTLRTLTAAALLALAASGHALTPIDQNTALAGNISAGDAPGFPITLSAPGSYQLGSNLIVPADTSAVEVTSAGVTLDLNGFSIVGPRVCTRDTVSFVVTCTGTPVNTMGVLLQGGSSALRNGRVRGFAWGVYVGAGGSELDQLLIEHNTVGVFVDPDFAGRAPTLIRHVRSQLNSAQGFAGQHALVRNSSAGANGFNGFQLTRSVVLDSVAFNNKQWGFSGGNTSIGGSVAKGNLLGNIFTPSYDTLGGNRNGAVAY